MNKHFRPLNSAADARIRTRGHTERIIATGTPGGTHAFAALRHEGRRCCPRDGSGDSVSDVRNLSEDDR
jgi:hypothetical protein